jgi:hypothetical protein
MRTVAAVTIIVLVACGATAVAADEPVLISGPKSVKVEDGAADLTIASESGTPVHLLFFTADADGNRLAQLGERDLGPGDVTQIRFRAGASFGQLVVVAGGPSRSHVLRIPLASEPSAPAVEKWTVINRRAASDTDEPLPLTGDCAGLALDAKPLGTVAGEGEALTIRGKCLAGDKEHLQLVIPDTTAGREYSGKIKVGESEVELTVKDTACAGLVLLLLLIGLAAAGFAGWFTAAGRGVWELRRRLYLVERMVAEGVEHNADAEFAAAARRLGLPKNVAEWTIADGVRKELARIRRRDRTGADAEQLKRLGKELRKVRRAVRTWAAFANTLDKLVKQDQTFARLPGYRTAIWKRTMDRTGALGPAAMRDARKAATEALDIAREWPADRIEVTNAVAESISAPAATLFKTWLTQIVTLTDADAIRDARDTYVKKHEGDVAAAAADLAEDHMYLVRAATPHAVDGEDVESHRDVKVKDPGVKALRIAIGISGLDMVIFLVLLGVALVAGMQELWVDETFGGLWDCLAAVAWGFGSGAISGTLTNAVSNLGRDRLLG